MLLVVKFLTILNYLNPQQKKKKGKSLLTCEVGIEEPVFGLDPHTLTRIKKNDRETRVMKLNLHCGIICKCNNICIGQLIQHYVIGFYMSSIDPVLIHQVIERV